MLAFIVGFAMLGALTFLPTYLQYVQGVSATSSGIRTLPLVAGLLLMSVFSGNAVSKTGKYRIFPIAGSAVMAVGMYLLSRLNESTSVLVQSLAMFVLGIGIGLCMQVLMIIVQNTVEYTDLGVATSGITFFRTLGSSFGAAVFGAVYANKLASNLKTAFASHPDIDPRAAESPKALHALPPVQRAPLVHAYALTVHSLFLYAIPVAIVALLFALMLKQVPLRDSARAGAADLGEGFGFLDAQDSERELERALARVIRRDGSSAAAGILAASGTRMSEAAAWTVAQVHLHGKVQGQVGLKAIADAHRVPASVLEPAFADTIRKGYLQVDGDELVMTRAGQDEFAKVAHAWKAWLRTKLPDPDDGGPSSAALDRALQTLAAKVTEQEQLALAA